MKQFRPIHGILGVAFACAALLLSSASPRQEGRTWEVARGGYDTLFHTLPLRPQGLQFPGGRQAFERFHERLAAPMVDGHGAVRVVHIGGSHVQAGWMGDRIRERWLEGPGSACSRGLIAPYRMAGTNTPPRVRTEFTRHWNGTRCSRSRHQGPFGGVGLSAVTFDSAATWWHAVTRSDSSAYATSRITVLADAQGLLPVWDGADSTVRVRRTALEHGAGWVLELTPAVDTLFLGLEPDSVGGDAPRWFRLHGLVAEQPECPCEGLVYHEIGNNGASTASVLRGAGDAAFHRDWAVLDPDLVIFGLGINDAHGPATRFDPEGFTARYDSLIGLIRQTQPDAAFLFLTNTDSFYGRRPNPSALAVREAMFEVAARHGAAVFDLFDAMGGLGAMEVWREAGYARSDRIHFTREGYRVIADLYWDALLWDWAKSQAVSRRRIQIPSPARGREFTPPTDSTAWKS